jgi:hypothetical protein
MPDLPISYFPIAERQHCSEALQKLFADLESTLGFVPNVIRGFAGASRVSGNGGRIVTT